MDQRLNMNGKPFVTTSERPVALAALLAYMRKDIDTAKSIFPLCGYCFMTGFLDAVSFSAIFIWCGFQTGNFCQLALAIARLFQGPSGHRDLTFHIADRQALTSLISFNIGAFLGRIGDRIGTHTRSWLVFGTLLQAVFLAAASVSVWRSGESSVASNRGDPAWRSVDTYIALAFMSASLGLQGVMGKRLNTQFTTTIVLTTVWCELMADPLLFSWPPRIVISRDHKVLAAGSLFLGAFVARALLDRLGAAAALGIGVGVRVLISLWWLRVPSPDESE